MTDTQEPAVPIRFRVFSIRASRFVASAATLALSLPTIAAQPRFPDAPPAAHDDQSPHGKAAPYVVPHDDAHGPSTHDLTPHDAGHGVVPIPHVEEPTHSAPAPMEHGNVPHVEAYEQVPHVAPYGPAPSVGGHKHGPPIEWPAPPEGPMHLPSSPPIYGSQPQGGDPFQAPPFAGGGGSSGYVPYEGIAAPFGPMRPMAPLAMLPPVTADPAISTPLGTLGHTYYRPSRYVPVEQHPRVGLLVLTLPPELTVEQGRGLRMRVTVHDSAGQLKTLKGFFGEDKKWHFESEPLIPGIPHIYRVTVERVRFENQEVRRYGRLVEQEKEIGAELLGVRYLRLIPGREVTLSF